MEVIKQIVSVVSCTLILYGVLSVILPEGSMKNSFKYIVSVALIYSVIISIKGLNINDFSLKDFETIKEFDQDEIKIEVVSIECEYARLKLEDFLRQQIVVVANNPFSVNVTTDISDSTDIFISEIVIYCNSKDVEGIASVINNLGLTAVFMESDGELNGH